MADLEQGHCGTGPLDNGVGELCNGLACGERDEAECNCFEVAAFGLQQHIDASRPALCRCLVLLRAAPRTVTRVSTDGVTGLGWEGGDREGGREGRDFEGSLRDGEKE